jgi:hypothetical protein
MAGEPDPVEEMRALIAKHGLTQAGAAEILTVPARTMRRWLSKDPKVASRCPPFAPDALRYRLARKNKRA